jgi:phage protein D
MPTAGSLTIELDGTELPADVAALLSSAHVDDSFRLPDLFLLRFRDQDHMVLAKANAKIGSKVKISVVTADKPAPESLIEGEITALETEFDTTGTFTIVRGYDQAHRLFRGRRSYSYVQVTASDVVQTVTQRAGLRPGDIRSTSTVFEHLSQAGQTDWEFLTGLATAIGYEITVKAGALDFKPPEQASGAPAAQGATPDPLVLQKGTDLLRFRAVLTAAEQVGEVQVRGWDIGAKQKLVGTAPAHTDSAQLADSSPEKMAQAFGDPVFVASDVPYRSQAEVDAAAKALAEQIGGAFAEFEGVARGNPKLRSGQAISVDSIGSPFDGKYTITTSRHRYDPTTGYTTAFAVTGRQERSLYGLAAGGVGAGRAHGVVIGIVSDVNDPEQQGRVKLTFPWLSDDYVSDWARTVQPGAGKDRGGMVVPEVGDEVLVAFEQQDFGRPYVLGGLFNGVDTPKSGGEVLVDSSSGAINRRSMVSRRGHRVDLLDADGRTEGISLRSADEKLVLTLDAVGTAITLHSDGTVLIEGAQGITVDAKSSPLQLKGDSVAISAKSGGVDIASTGGSVTVAAGTTLGLKGATSTLEGTGQVTVKGGATATVQAALVKIN